MAINQEQIIGMVDRMPTFPASAHRVIELTNDINCAPRDLVDVIEHDPILTLKVLKLVNSSFFSLAQEVTSVQHAVVYLGINTIKNLALSVATIGALPSTNSLGFDMTAFWVHSLLTAALARQIIEKKTTDEVLLSNSFVGGLLHDIGKIVFLQFLSADYGRCCELAAKEGRSVVALEQEIIGVSHAELGALVAERWQLPASLVAGIRVHHSLDMLDEESHLGNTLVIGNELSKHAVVEEEIDFLILPSPVQNWLGADLKTTFNQLSGLPGEIEKAQLFVQLGS
ncbi:MAG: HDOD domain-containing protein [Bdellovibrionales bacterium]|nr:HDOD domain-containing protein [Bdellovibrionales bacterium]